MALVTAITPTAFNFVTKVKSITDSTGAYASPANEGGYGSPNPERNTLGVFIVIETISPQFSVASPEMKFKQKFHFGDDVVTDTSWEIPILEDGVYGFTLIALEKVDGIDNLGDTATERYVIDTEDNKVYYVNNGSVSEVQRLDWSKITTGYSASTEEFIDKFTEEYLMQKVLDSRNSGCLCGDKDYEIEAVLDAARISYSNADAIKAQEFLNLVFSLKN